MVDWYLTTTTLSAIDAVCGADRVTLPPDSTTIAARLVSLRLILDPRILSLPGVHVLRFKLDRTG